MGGRAGMLLADASRGLRPAQRLARGDTTVRWRRSSSGDELCTPDSAGFGDMQELISTSFRTGCAVGFHLLSHGNTNRMNRPITMIIHGMMVMACTPGSQRAGLGIRQVVLFLGVSFMAHAFQELP